MTEREIIERLKELRSENNKAEFLTSEDKEKIQDRKKMWMTYWRQNPEVYIEKKMTFHSFGYQNFSYHLMNEATNYEEISTRGVGKTLRVIVYATCMALLYPYSKIGIGAVTRSQADEDFQTTFDKEVCGQFSIFCRWLKQKGLITSRETEKGFMVTFFNGSIMYFFPVIDSSRGLHVNLLIGEEIRLIPKGKWDSIAVPMLVPRQPPFKSLSQYVEHREYDEPTKVILISSNRFADEWFNRQYNKTFVSYFKDKLNKNIVFSLDVYLAIKHGLRTIPWLLAQQRDMNDIDFRCEILNETIGEADGAYFSREQFAKNQVIKKSFMPPTVEEFKNGTAKNRKKGDNEYRFVFVDFSWAGDNGLIQNDQTVIGCAACYMKDEKLHRDVEYIETYSGSDAAMIPLRVKEVFWDYNADYVVYDNRSGGELLFNQLSSPQDNPHRTNNEWNNHGFTVCEEKDLQMVSDDKLKDLRARTIDPQAIPCLIPIVATRESNSSMWQDMQLRLKNEDISFLIDELEFDTLYSDKKEYMFLSSEDKARFKLPYVQTMLMITEAVSLTQNWSNGLLKLEEHGRGSYKDKIVATCYFNSIASKLENKLLKEDNQEDLDISEYRFIY
jgi:hypothetical protein